MTILLLFSYFSLFGFFATYQHVTTGSAQKKKKKKKSCEAISDGSLFMSVSAWVRVCVHMHVFCISMEEYAQHREACLLPSRTAPSPASSLPCYACLCCCHTCPERSLLKLTIKAYLSSNLAVCFCSWYVMLKGNIRHRLDEKHHGCQGRMQLVIILEWSEESTRIGLIAVCLWLW